MAVDGLPGPQVFKQRDVRRTNAPNISGTSLAPVGAVIAWLKTYASTPALPSDWVECDGAVINDADSVYNGQNSPDLNGGIFLEGQATSGATGGVATGTGEITLVNSAGYTLGDTVGIGTVANNGTVLTGAGGDNAKVLTKDITTDENRPPFYTVVWIMRVR